MACRSYYSGSLSDFLNVEEDVILATMVRNNPFDLNDLQRDSWISEIRILKDQLSGLESGYVIFEYTIPRMGKRVDVVVLYCGIIFLLEFKNGNAQSRSSALKRVLDYALDLKNFHKGSRDKVIVPLAIPINLICQEIIVVSCVYDGKRCKVI